MESAGTTSSRLLRSAMRCSLAVVEPSFLNSVLIYVPKSTISFSAHSDQRYITNMCKGADLSVSLIIERDVQQVLGFKLHFSDHHIFGH